MTSIKRELKSFDFVLVILVCVLSLYGIIIIGSISSVRVDVVSKLYKNQQLFFATGLILMIVTALIDYRFICKFYIVIYIFNIALLLLVFLLPQNNANANTNVARWIDVGGKFSIQPSEFSKIFLIIFIAKYVDKKIDKINNVSVLLSVFLLTGIPMIIILKQPSLSAALVSLAILFSILFVAKLNYKYVLSILFLGFVGVTTFIYDILYNGKKIVNSIIKFGIIKDYHINRIVAFLEKSEKDDLYIQTYNSIVAIGSGQFSGMGLKQGTFNKLSYIDNTENDFILSVIGEEFGFVGSVAAIAIVFLIIIKCLLIANRSESNLGKLIIAGVVGLIFFQVFINVGVATGIAVNTGMSFPFLCSGGSSMWTNMIAIGLVINIGMEKPKSIFE